MKTLLASLLLTLPAFGADNLARHTVVVCNTNEPASLPLAEHYAGLRGIPTNQICRLACRVAETVTRREFNRDIRDPLRQFVTDDKHVSVLALIYGVPLRVEADVSLTNDIPANLPKELRRNEASVDSELTLLPQPDAPLTGPVPNPFFQYRRTTFPAALRGEMLLVGRLDGPTPAIVRRMMDDAVAVERTGLTGCAYFDLRGLHDGPYALGDAWLRASAEACRTAGFEIELDEKDGVWGEDKSLTNAAIYAGWYATHATGAVTRADFRFRPGAVAVHIHSTSGASLRTTTSYWAGPLLHKGAAVTIGNVFEPYLTLTPHLPEFFRRLLAGATLVEAGWASQPVLSWQTTFVGDPLYRPKKD
jgi:uncharacterized protein (TIGR03790 family)